MESASEATGNGNGLLYFAYGSNMGQRRMLARIPRASFQGIATLPYHELRFHKISLIDGSGKCDAYRTGLEEDRVFGVLYRIRTDDLPALDRFEGQGLGYDREEVSVLLESGEQVRALSYFATRINPALQPMDWYHEHVLHGAREAGLPEDYLARIETVVPTPDYDLSRREHELSIYQSNNE